MRKLSLSKKTFLKRQKDCMITEQPAMMISVAFGDINFYLLCLLMEKFIQARRKINNLPRLMVV